MTEQDIRKLLEDVRRGRTGIEQALARLKKLPLWKVADIMAPSIALGYFFGRIGCLLNNGQFFLQFKGFPHFIEVLDLLGRKICYNEPSVLQNGNTAG